PKASNSVVFVGNAPSCWVSKRHCTVVGPFVSIVPESLSGTIGPVHPAMLRELGSTSTVTLVTVAFGASTTGMPETFPAVFVTLLATQQRRLELSGSMICHQPASPDFPVIWELAPTFKPLRTIQPMPGPRRQLTATSLGDATGTDGVKVAVGG